MIINQNAIKNAVLFQTLLAEVERLNRICSNYNFSVLNNNIIHYQREIILLDYQLVTKSSFSKVK